MTTLNLQVGASISDARESTTPYLDYTGATVNVGGANWWGYWRWTAAIPQGATVNTATFQANVVSVDYDDPIFTIYCEDADTSADIACSGGACSDLSDRTETTASVAQSASSVGTGWYTMPDVSSPVQDVIAREGWASGNALAILVKGGASCNVRFVSWDSDTALAGKLDIDYTTAVAALPVISGDGVNSLVFGGVTVR